MAKICPKCFGTNEFYGKACDLCFGGIVANSVRMKYNAEEGVLVHDFLKQFMGKFSSDQYWHSYPRWSMGGSTWHGFRNGGTYIMLALQWYHHIHKPGSKEWRPQTIMRGLLIEAMKWEQENDESSELNLPNQVESKAG